MNIIFVRNASTLQHTKVIHSNTDRLVDFSHFVQLRIIGLIDSLRERESQSYILRPVRSIYNKVIYRPDEYSVTTITTTYLFIYRLQWCISKFRCA